MSKLSLKQLTQLERNINSVNISITKTHTDIFSYTCQKKKSVTQSELFS